MASTEVDSAAAAGSELATPPMRLQILSTEHWSLLASRGLAWNESFTRAGMFLSTLSFATVALALVAQATGFSADFRLFALVILPVVLFLGIGTQLRLDHANYHDVQCIVGMNRIRAKYAEMAPDLAGLFVMGQTDDTAGIARTMGLIPWRSTPLNLIAATPVVVGVLNGVLFAAIVALAHALQIKVIGEGVESEQQRDLLRRVLRDVGEGQRLAPGRLRPGVGAAIGDVDVER